MTFRAFDRPVSVIGAGFTYILLVVIIVALWFRATKYIDENTRLQRQYIDALETALSK